MPDIECTALPPCECGCGLPTHRAQTTHLGRGYRVGDALPRRKGHHRRTASEDERFLSFLASPDPVTGCIEFTGHRHCGYGQFGVGSRDKGTRRLVYAHRYAWGREHGPIPPETPHVLHDCPYGDNPACCNTAHLWLGTNADNRLDMARKRRGHTGALPYGVARNHRRWYAKVRGVYLGTYDTIEQAAAIAAAAREAEYGPRI